MSNELTVYERNGEPKTDSLKVAEKFGKRPDNVLQALDRLECSEAFRLLNFQETAQLDSQGKDRRVVEMTFDGFMFLAMGFTGSEAAKVKEWYISQFNAMRRELQERATGLPVSTAGMSAAQLRFLGATLTAQAEASERIAKQDEVIAELLPDLSSWGT